MSTMPASSSEPVWPSTSSEYPSPTFKGLDSSTLNKPDTMVDALHVVHSSEDDLSLQSPKFHASRSSSPIPITINTINEEDELVQPILTTHTSVTDSLPLPSVGGGGSSVSTTVTPRHADPAGKSLSLSDYIGLDEVLRKVTLAAEQANNKKLAEQLQHRRSMSATLALQAEAAAQAVHTRELSTLSTGSAPTTLYSYDLSISPTPTTGSTSYSSAMPSSSQPSPSPRTSSWLHSAPNSTRSTGSRTMFTFPADSATSHTSVDDEPEVQHEGGDGADDREAAINSSYSSPSFTAVSRQSSTADSMPQSLPVIEEDSHSQSSPSVAAADSAATDLQPMGIVPPLEAANGAMWSMFAQTEDDSADRAATITDAPRAAKNDSQFDAAATSTLSADTHQTGISSPGKPSSYRSLSTAAASGVASPFSSSKSTEQQAQSLNVATYHHDEDQSHSYSPTASYHTAQREDSTSQQLSFGTPLSMVMQPSASPVPLTSTHRVSPTMQHYSIAEYIPDNVLAIADTTASSLGFKSISDHVTQVRQHKAAADVVDTNTSSDDAVQHHQPIIQQINSHAADMDPQPAPATSTPTNLPIPNVPQPTGATYIATV